jgi:hypothetical protein
MDENTTLRAVRRKYIGRDANKYVSVSGDTSNGEKLFTRQARANNTSQKAAKTSVRRK